jgi:hypothetical protein
MNNMSYFETSAKTGECVDEIFFTLTKNCVNQIEEEVNEEVYALKSFDENKRCLDKLKKYCYFLYFSI